ncbi:MAG: hypothetical protein ACLFWL_17465 [Candidatus Brocadiia bacterium]
MDQQRPFKIQIFVAEGMPDGLRFVEKSNWIGLGIVCPRGRYPAVKEREEFFRSGVYLLVGQDGRDERPNQLENKRRDVAEGTSAAGS